MDTPGTPDAPSAPSGDSATPAVSGPVSARGTARTTVGLTKTANRARVAGGALIRFTIAIRVTGKTAGLELKVCDRLPGTMTFVDAPGASFAKGRACWTRVRLRAGQRAAFKIVARLDRGVGVGRTCNTATGSATNAATVRATACIRTHPALAAVTGRTVGVTG